MNKIYKKIWNMHRRCFVAVSEAASSASQASGKAALAVFGASMLIEAPAQAEQILIGDFASGSLFTHKCDALYENTTVNGNLTLSAAYGPRYLYVGVTNDGDDCLPDRTLTVNGNFIVIDGGWLAIGHNNRREELDQDPLAEGRDEEEFCMTLTNNLLPCGFLWFWLKT